MPKPQGPPRLTGAAARALPFIEHAVSQGISATTLQTSLSASGIGVRRQDLLDAFRSVKGAESSAQALASLRSDFRPNPERLAYAVTKQLREYSFRVKVTGFNLSTGKDETRHFSISTNELLSRNEIEDVALGYSTDEENYLPFEPSGVTLLSATRR
jgi:hypothetical protein